ncbi:hypothetical protein [Intestinibacter sp.]|uniref:hypothetical protein n=1 Tax=Intestinibacter sp. TaxID=1965304 RepID=UPI002A91BE54|nr:hypothetical protein [Intestinibacter sp.]MDY5212392.1 hypothetical protein [Intestinibacter sp.]
MPAWSFHIKLATEISNTLNLNKEDENLFILSNLIPDIKSGFLIPMDKPFPSKYSHYYIYKDELSLPDLKKYKNIYWNKNDIVSTGIYCHILLDYYLNNMLKENYFIYNKENIITGMKTLNGVFYGDRESCIKFKHKNFNLIAESLDIQNKFSFPKQNIDVKTDGGIYTITPNDIRLTEEWIFEHYKNQKLAFPKNELMTKEDINKFFKDSKEFVLKHIKI